MKKILFFTLALAVAMAACTNDPTEPGGNGGGGGGGAAGSSANEWIYGKMQEVYLYNSIYSGFTPNYSLDTKSFFNSLLSSSAANNDGKHTGGRDYFYSTIDITGTKAASMAATYGMEYMAIQMGSGGPIYGRVLYVTPGSAADGAELTRGDWISKVNGAALTETNYTQLTSGGAVTLSVQKADFAGETLQFEAEQILNMAAASTVDKDPILVTKVFEGGILPAGRKVGYIVYNAFQTGPAAEGYNITNGTYMVEMKSVFSAFKNTYWVTDMIVDLRYNPGGYVECCRLLASFMAPAGALGQVFSQMKYNGTLPDQTLNYYEAAKLPEHLGLSGAGTVYVLTSGWTASSSELLINSLRPYINIKIIGTQTEGKNVGSNEYSNSEYGMTLHPITFRSYNKNNQSDYAGGFTPDIVRNENEGTGLSQMKELGDPNEYLLSAALQDIAAPGSVSVFAPAVARVAGGTRVGGAEITVLPRPEIGGVKGMIMTE